MAARIALLFGCVWAAGVIAAAPFCLRPPAPNWPRDLWMASAVCLLPLLPKLARFAVAAPYAPRKMLSVYGDMMRRMALALGVALALFFWAEAGLTDRFWVGLAFFYQIALALETTLLLDAWNKSPPTAPKADGRREAAGSPYV